MGMRGKSLILFHNLTTGDKIMVCGTVGQNLRRVCMDVQDVTFLRQESCQKYFYMPSFT